jgi:hypothetical protein
VPKIQLIRKDGQIIELDATDIGMSVTRGVSVWPIPIIATRAALDLNSNMLAITINGVITDDTASTGDNGAACVLDLSKPTAACLSWIEQLRDEYGVAATSGTDGLKDILHGKEIVFSTTGQINAGSGEKIILRFDKASTFSSSVATESVVRVDLSGTAHKTNHIATAIKTGLDGATVKVGGVNTAVNSILTTTLSLGDQATLSASKQGLGSPVNEKVTITNITTGSSGNIPLVKRGAMPLSATADWSHAFFMSTFTGGVDGSRKSKGDKVQDLLNMTMNANAGGFMVSPQALTGDLVELPDSLSSFDTSKLLGISESSSVRKYIVGLRIPYESMVTAGVSGAVLRQFIIPSGPGTDYPSEENTEVFDPTNIEGGEITRPNPFFRQKVAIPGVIQTFQPAYAAGDSVWTYTLGFAAVEQLIGV